MTQKWERIQSLFLEALDLPPQGRASFLDRACAGDEEVRRQVESLIAHDGTGDQQLAEALEDTAQSLLESEDLSGTRLGVWRVLNEIGRGGMGTVYLAARDDDQFRKLAAIKVVTRGMDTEELVNRFRHERQILAHLDHPFIARLIDGGNTPQGRAFLVMEYVQGRPIDVYCRQDGLDVEARCGLFLKVCDAVSYAHRNLVIHRDLKPGNILVAADGSPKLLDFGVAKLLDPEVDPGHTTTVVGGRLITPEYASPEQVRGQLVGTASDIYALGAILYELLTEVKAQPLDSHSPPELEKVICQADVQPPSQRVGLDNHRLRKRLSGDLDNIVLMAMRKEPERRYSSVDLLARDISRHLEGQTVTARPPSATYRLGKFVHRHRVSLAFISLVVISLVGGTWAALLEAHRARIEQRRAEARLSQIVELANRALFDVHGSIERLPGATDARRQLVKTTLDYLEKLSKDAGDDDRLRMALGAAYFRLGDLQGYPFTPNLGDTAGAIKSFQSSSALLEPLRRAHPKDAEAQRRWLATQDHLATLLNQTGDSSGAAKLLRDALPAAVALARSPNAGVDGERIQADYYSLLAAAVREHNSTEALTYARRYLEIYTRLAAGYPDRAEFVNEESDAYSLVGRLLQAQGDSPEALHDYLQCVALREALGRAHPNDVVYKRNLMIGYGHVGDTLGNPVLSSLGDSAGARDYYRKAVAIGEEIHEEDPSDATAKFDLAAGLVKLGMVDVPASDVAESLATLQRAIGMLEEIVANDPHSLPRVKILTLAREYEGHRLRSLGKYRQAIASYRRSVELSDSILETNPTDRGALSQAVASSRAMATARAMAGDRAEALSQAKATIRRAEAGVNAANGDGDQRIRRLYVAESTIELGSIYEILARQSRATQQRQDWKAAQSTLRQAISVLDEVTAQGKPISMSATDMQHARKLLAEADGHLSASEALHP